VEQAPAGRCFATSNLSRVTRHLEHREGIQRAPGGRRRPPSRRANESESAVRWAAPSRLTLFDRPARRLAHWPSCIIGCSQRSAARCCASSCSRPASRRFPARHGAVGSRPSWSRRGAYDHLAASSTLPAIQARSGLSRSSQVMARPSFASPPGPFDEGTEHDGMGAAGGAAVRAAVPGR
jgi:hypothetical protein